MIGKLLFALLIVWFASSLIFSIPTLEKQRNDFCKSIGYKYYESHRGIEECRKDIGNETIVTKITCKDIGIQALTFQPINPDCRKIVEAKT